MIECSRLRLRRFRSEDLPHVVALESNPEIVAPTGIRFPNTPDVTASRLQAWMARQDGALGIFACELCEAPHAFVGWFMVLPAENEWPEIGYMLLQEQWRKGYASEAVRALANYALALPDVPGLRALSDPENISSCRVLENAGFEFQETIKKWDKKLDREIDLKLYLRSR